MGICVPKHVVCGWYTPNFTAGVEGCTLPTAPAETRGKLTAGGTFFRSIEFGSHVDNINISATYQVGGAGSPDSWRDYNTGSPTFDAFTDIVGLRVVITDGSTTENYYILQEALGESPDAGWSVNGITELRSKISASSTLVTMPDLDNNGGWDKSTDEETILGAFSGSLSGGTGAPVTGLGSIRTGPFYTLYHIQDSEDIDGNTYTANVVRFWNGASWNSFSSTSPSNCANPNDPPTDCHLGPT
jgi:hypothetical protein